MTRQFEPLMTLINCMARKKLPAKASSPALGTKAARPAPGTGLEASAGSF